MPDDRTSLGADRPILIAMNQDQHQRAAPVPDAEATGLRVGYVMTHYPRLAQTFIAGEIDAVERAGVEIRCFAMNAPDAAELEASGAAERAARTTYLKTALAGAVGALLALLVRHPIGASRILAKAIASGGGNPARTMRRLAHAAQAARLASAVRQSNIAHLHAHFGLAPATIAWLASAFASLGGRPVGFSFTKDGSTVFAALGPANRVAVIDTATLAVTKYLLVGQRVWHLVLTPEEDLLFTTIGVSNDVTVIDVKTLKAIKSIKVGRYPWGAAIRPVN